MGAQWKHKGREAAANAKGRIFTKLSKEIMMAARSGSDPSTNPRLRMAVDAARKASMTKDTLERAIKKGAGLLDDSMIYELATYEGFAPYQVPVIVECLTENTNRSYANMRVAFRKGQLGNSGSVSWDFLRLGSIEATPPAGADPEEAAIECGAEDLESADDGMTRFFTTPTQLDVVSKALAERKWNVVSAALIWKAKNPVAIDDETKRAEIEAFLGAIDDDDDVQNLYVGLL